MSFINNNTSLAKRLLTLFTVPTFSLVVCGYVRIIPYSGIYWRPIKFGELANLKNRKINNRQNFSRSCHAHNFYFLHVKHCGWMAKVGVVTSHVLNSTNLISPIEKFYNSAKFYRR